MTSSDAPAAPPNSLARTLPRFLVIAVSLALILFAIRLYRLEPNRPFFAMMYLAAGGFVIHAWLPQRWRLPFFCLLSMAAMVLFLGWPDGVWALGIGASLIALCRLPLPVGYRAFLIVVAGLGLALWRIDTPAIFWPVLASMFMFRLIVYLYDTRHDTHHPPLSLTLAYFFPLPNLCFTLFPVIDFKTFRETYSQEDPYTTYQTGIEWIVRGLTHLLLYRYVKVYWLPEPHELSDPGHFLIFLAANYALYLQVSGWFHIITGVLHLYGFGLPRTHHNYFLASSLSDIWRRINIYWKDFMTKVFFYPAFFALRRLGTRVALVLAGLWVFVMTWLLHSYQVFWLRAELPLGWKEAALWLTAGVAVVISLQLELFFARKGRRPTPRPEGPGWVRAEAVAGAILALQIAATFFMVSLFWACWTLPQFRTYLRVMIDPGEVTVEGVLVVLGCLLGVAAVGALIRVTRVWLSRREWRAGGFIPPGWSPRFAVQVVVLLALVAAALPQVGEALGPGARELLATLRQDSTTPAEAALIVQGYYEELAATPVQVAPLLDLPGLRREKASSLVYADMARKADDFLEYEMIPGWSGEIGGQPLTVNSLGMRDREGITRAKPPGVCRLAFVGSSVLMGWGTRDEETFTRLFEARLRARPPGGSGKVEVLNFGTGKSFAIHRKTVLERKVLGFTPDAVYYVAHQDEYLGPTGHLALLLARHNEVPEYLQDIARRAGITPQTAQGEAEVRLQKFAPEILQRVYADFVTTCQARGILPVWVYVPMPGTVDARVRAADLVALAKKAGFVVVHLARWAEGHAPQELLADPHHANARGHQLIAEHLAAALREQPEALPACLRP